MEIIDYFEEIEKEHGDFRINGKWYVPLFGSDTIQHIIDDSTRLEKPVMPLATDMREHLFQQLKAQISVYAGKKDGGLAILQDVIHKLVNGEEIVCESCGHKINGNGRH